MGCTVCLLQSDHFIALHCSAHRSRDQVLLETRITIWQGEGRGQLAAIDGRIFVVIQSSPRVQCRTDPCDPTLSQSVLCATLRRHARRALGDYSVNKAPGLDRAHTAHTPCTRCTHQAGATRLHRSQDPRQRRNPNSLLFTEHHPAHPRSTTLHRFQRPPPCALCRCIHSALPLLQCAWTSSSLRRLSLSLSIYL